MTEKIATTEHSVQPPPVQAQNEAKTRKVITVGVALALIILFSVILHLWCRRSKARPTVTETPLKLITKDFPTVVDSERPELSDAEQGAVRTTSIRL